MNGTGVAVNVMLEARYVPRAVVPGLLFSGALAALGIATALAGVAMGWILAAFMLWSVANALAKMRRTEPVLTLDEEGATDHRVPLHVAWDNVASMRTVDRRVVFAKVPLLELVPAEPVERRPRTLIGAVLRGDIAFADARNTDRVMIDLRYLDHTPEQVLAAARALRGTVLTMAMNEKPEIEVPDGAPSYQLEIEDLAVGDGDEATAGKIVEVHYVGVSWQTQRQFDASWDRGDTFKFKLGRGQVIPGWDQGVEGMKVGGRRKITIPPNLAYGKRGAGGVIGPDETLIFVVDLVGVS